jgi:hypothetical protein
LDAIQSAYSLRSVEADTQWTRNLRELTACPGQFFGPHPPPPPPVVKSELSPSLNDNSSVVLPSPLAKSVGGCAIYYKYGITLPVGLVHCNLTIFAILPCPNISTTRTYVARQETTGSRQLNTSQLKCARLLDVYIVWRESRRLVWQAGNYLGSGATETKTSHSPPVVYRTHSINSDYRLAMPLG